MKPRYDKRTEAQGQLAYHLIDWLKHKRPTIKPKLFGNVGTRYNMPLRKKNLWVYADFWRLKWTKH